MIGPGPHYGSGVAQSAETIPGQPAGVHPGHLGGHVRPEAHETPAGLVHHLHGAQVQVLADACEQGVQELHLRRHDQGVPPPVVKVQKPPPQTLYGLGPLGQNVFDPLGEQPAIHRLPGR